MTIPDTTEKMIADHTNAMFSAVLGADVMTPDLVKQAHEVVERAEASANPVDLGHYTDENFKHWAATASLGLSYFPTTFKVAFQNSIDKATAACLRNSLDMGNDYARASNNFYFRLLLAMQFEMANAIERIEKVRP